MIADILKELDKVANQALKECAQPISSKIQYEAGRRIGVIGGIARARQAIIELNSRDDDKDKDL
jgi:hypothetical protein